MSRLQAILETLPIFALFCLHGGWPVPDVNEPYYLGKAIHFWNPHWCSSDWFLQTTDTHTMFYLTAGWLALFLKPTAFALTLRLLIWALLAWSWQRLSRAVVPTPWASVLTATLFVFLLQHYGMAGEWVVGGAEAKGFAFVLVFLALEAMVEGYWNRMWILLGLASAFHILVGGWAAIAAGTVWIFRSWTLAFLTLTPRTPEKEDAAWMLRNWTLNPSAPIESSSAEGAPGPRSSLRRSVSSWIAPLAAFVLALPGLVPPLVMNRGVDPAVVSKANQIYVYERFPHHLDPAWFRAAGYVLPFLLLVGLWLLLWPTASDNPGSRRLRVFVAVAVAIALIGAAISLLGLYNAGLAASWMRFYWYRLADVAVPLGLALAAVRWFILRKMRVAMALLVAVAVFHVADCVVMRLFADPPFYDHPVDGTAWRPAYLWATGQPLRPLFPLVPRADKPVVYSDWIDVCSWIANPRHTSPDARFLTPRTALTFKWYAQRGEVVTWKEAPQDAASLVEWRKRIEDVYGTGNPPPCDEFYTSLVYAGVPKLRALAKQYEADYLLTQVRLPLLPLPVEYKNGSYVVYRLK